MNLGIEKTVHGESIASAATDGFALVLNTPWQDKAISSNTYNTVTFDGYTPTSTKYVWDGKTLNNGSNSTGIDVTNDIIMLSRYDNLVHRFFIDDGKANLRFAGILSNFITDSQHVQAENAVVADFDGDGYQYFAALYIDRTGSQLRAKSHLRIYINEKKGSFTDQTESWLKGKFQNYRGGYYEMRLADVDVNGLQDIVSRVRPLWDYPLMPRQTHRLSFFEMTDDNSARFDTNR